MDKKTYFEQMRRQRRESILHEAKEMILKDGYDSFNIQQLARRLDISTVTLYKYYDNSESIMNALREQILENEKIFLAETHETEDPLENFILSLRHFFDNVMANHSDMRFLFLCDIHIGKESSSELKRMAENDFIYDQLLKAQTAGSVRRELDIRAVSDMIAHLNLGIMHQFSMMDETTYCEQLQTSRQRIEQLLDFYRYYLQTV